MRRRNFLKSVARPPHNRNDDICIFLFLHIFWSTGNKIPMTDDTRYFMTINSMSRVCCLYNTYYIFLYAILKSILRYCCLLLLFTVTVTVTVYVTFTVTVTVTATVTVTVTVTINVTVTVTVYCFCYCYCYCYFYCS